MLSEFQRNGYKLVKPCFFLCYRISPEGQSPEGNMNDHVPWLYPVTQEEAGVNLYIWPWNGLVNGGV